MAARPATRTTRPTRERTDDAPARSPVRDLTRGATTFRIDWDVRPAFDFVFSLSDDAASTDDLPAADREWLAKAKAAMPAPVRDATQRLFASELCINAAVLIVDRPNVRTSACAR